MELSGQKRGAGSALRGERGQTSAEYLGIILVVVAIISAISAADIGAAISVQVERAVCQIAADGDGGVECKGAGAATEKRSGARARPAPNLYDAEATPKLAGLNARSPKFVAMGASARAETERAESPDATGSAQSRGAAGPAGLPLALLTPPVLTPPVTSEGGDALRGFVKEWSGLGDAERAFEALAEGRYGEALVPGILALPWSKALKVGTKIVKVGTKIVEKGAEKLGPQAKKLWKKLGEERGSVGLPAARAARGPSLRESHRIARAARKRGVRILNARLAGQVYERTGVRYKESGFLDMTPFAQVINGTKNVRVKGMTGNEKDDFKLANETAGFKKGETPEGFTWHHVEDGKTMQLVPKHLNRDTPHTGGAALLREGVVKPAK